MTDDKPAGDLLRSAPNHLAKLFVANVARAEVRRIVHEAFAKYLVVDPTTSGNCNFASLLALLKMIGKSKAGTNALETFMARPLSCPKQLME